MRRRTVKQGKGIGRRRPTAGAPGQAGCASLRKWAVRSQEGSSRVLAFVVRWEVVEGFEQRRVHRLAFLEDPLGCCVHSSLEGGRGTHQGTSTMVQADAWVLQPALAVKEGRSAWEKPG